MASRAKGRPVRLALTMMIRAGTAGPSPPVGPKIGGMGLNIMNFCREFNARTEHVLTGVPINTHITVFADRTYELKLFTPPTTYFILRVAGLGKGSATGQKENFGQISLKAVYEIAKIKMQDPHLSHLEHQAMCKTVIAAARSCGVEVVRELDPLFMPRQRRYPQL